MSVQPDVPGVLFCAHCHALIKVGDGHTIYDDRDYHARCLAALLRDAELLQEEPSLDDNGLPRDDTPANDERV